MPRRRAVRRDIVHRWEGNPLLTIEDLDFRCTDIRNAGVALYKGEEVLLVCIESLAGFQSLYVARQGEKGVFNVAGHPCIGPETQPDNIPHESHGVMDARITYLDKRYYVMYVARGDHGFRLGLSHTTDFEHFENVGLVSEPDTKAGALFPAKIKGKYARTERPEHGNAMWISYSDDLIHWGESEPIMGPRGGFWDSSRIGIGPPPMEIKEGWLFIYYGARDTSAGPLYRMGAAIVDRNDPTKVVGRTNIPILSPREHYERVGDTPNIVFSTGAFVEPNGTLRIYYGAADGCICIGTTTVGEVVEQCMESKEEF